MRLQRSVYGPKHSACIWFELIAGYVKKAGLTELKPALCVFQNEVMIVICYVDDLLIFAASENNVEALKMRLGRNLALKDFGNPTQFLGIAI